jgi:signal transduction histidine kinase
LQIHVPLALSDGRTLHSVMRLVPSIGIQETSDQSIFCIFILLTGPYFDQLRESLIAEGKQSERNRLRDALHAEIGQQLLGAAFGCETIADKIANLDQDLGREASHLADLLSRATQALHAVVNPSDEMA